MERNNNRGSERETERKKEHEKQAKGSETKREEKSKENLVLSMKPSAICAEKARPMILVGQNLPNQGPAAIV